MVGAMVLKGVMLTVVDVVGILAAVLSAAEQPAKRMSAMLKIK